MAQLQHGATCRTRLIANACCHLVAARQHSMRMGNCPRMDESIGLVPAWWPPNKVAKNPRSNCVAPCRLCAPPVRYRAKSRPPARRRFPHKRG